MGIGREHMALAKGGSTTVGLLDVDVDTDDVDVDVEAESNVNAIAEP
jgi:hypothetical protein